MDKNMQLIIIDTNFWLLFFEKAINILEGIEDLFLYKPFFILIPSAVIKELENFSNQKNKKALAAKSSLRLIDSLIKQKKAKIVKSFSLNADNAILDLAKQKKAFVATADLKLIKRLKAKKILAITLKDKHLIRFV